MRSAAGRFPVTLPKEPWSLDPYNGKPFVYKPGKDRFKLYSVGKDGKDDGGTWASSTGRTDDVEYNAARRPK